MSPVVGSFPPRWYVRTGPLPLRLLSRMRFRWTIRRLERILLIEGHCDRETADAIDRFKRNAEFMTGRKPRFGQLMTDESAAGMFAALMSFGGGPPDDDVRAQ